MKLISDFGSWRAYLILNCIMLCENLAYSVQIVKKYNSFVDKEIKPPYVSELLKGLEKRGYIVSSLDHKQELDMGGRKRYYSVSRKGIIALEQIKETIMGVSLG